MIDNTRELIIRLQQLNVNRDLVTTVQYEKLKQERAQNLFGQEVEFQGQIADVFEDFFFVNIFDGVLCIKCTLTFDETYKGEPIQFDKYSKLAFIRFRGKIYYGERTHDEYKISVSVEKLLPPQHNPNRENKNTGCLFLVPIFPILWIINILK